MEIQLEERYLKRSEVQDGHVVRFQLVEIEKRELLSKLKKPYTAIVLQCVGTDGEAFAISCFSNELTACVRKYGKETNRWLGHQFEASEYTTSGGRAEWKIVPITTLETV